MRSSILNKKTLIIVIGLFLLASAIVFLPRFLFGNKNQFTGTVPNNPASKVCQKISQAEDVYSCLAEVNADSSFCQKVESEEEKNICFALADKDISFCRKIKDQDPKEICYYELSFTLGDINYCDELDDWEKCYFSFVHRLYWQERSNEIKAQYCEKLSKSAGGDMAFRNTCWALKAGDASFCQGNEHCLSFFKQPLSFCETTRSKGKADCLRDRALTARDTSICEKIDDVYFRDNCYSSYSAHIFPDLSLCEKVSDKMTRNECYREYAINLSGR
ncbi:MAG: hypothetical protein WBE27_00115 [Microgenomates group bacterium]